MVKNPPGKVGDMGLIPVSKRTPGGGNSHSSILAWNIPWTEEPGGSQRVGHDLVTEHANMQHHGAILLN